MNSLEVYMTLFTYDNLIYREFYIRNCKDQSEIFYSSNINYGHLVFGSTGYSKWLIQNGLCNLYTNRILGEPRVQKSLDQSQLIELISSFYSGNTSLRLNYKYNKEARVIISLLEIALYSS